MESNFFRGMGGFLFLLFLLNFSSSALGDRLREEKLRVYDYPAQAKGCLRTADELLVRFKKQTGIELASIACKDSNPNTGAYWLEIIYFAEEEVPVVNTRDGRTTSQQGAYSFDELTPELLRAEVAHFEKATGLPIFVGYFTQDFSVLSGKSWFPEMMALGSPRLFPFVETRESIEAPPREIYPEMEKQITSSLLLEGVDVARVAVVSMGDLGFRYTIRYFAADELDFEYRNDLFYANAADCEWARKTLWDQMKKADASPLSILCGAPGYTEGIRQLYMHTWIKNRKVFYTPTSKYFPDLQQCIANKQAVFEFYQQYVESGVGAFDSTCSLTSDGYNVLLLRRN